MGQLLRNPGGYTGTWDALERVGIKPVSDVPSHRPIENAHERQYLFLSHGSVSRYLLKATKWEGQRIDQMLVRLPGARKKQVRVGGHKPWGVAIPWKMLVDKFMGDITQNEGIL